MPTSTYATPLRSFIAGVIIISSGCESGTSSRPQSISTARVMRFKHDFGVAQPKQQLRHVFSLSNESTEDWVVSDISGSCSCTTTSLKAGDTIPAGGKVSIEAAIKVRRDFGESSEQLIVKIDQSPPIALVLELNASVRPAIHIKPSRISIDAYSKDVSDPHTTTFDVRNFESTPWEELQVTPRNDWLNVKVRPLATASVSARFPPIQAWRVIVTPTVEQLDIGFTDGSIDVHGIKGSCSVKETVPVTVEKKDSVSVSPGKLFFLYSAPTQGAAATSPRQTIWISFADGVVIPNPESVCLQCTPHDCVELEWKSTVGHRWELEARAPSKAPAVANGSLLVQFNSDEALSLKVPVSFTTLE